MSLSLVGSMELSRDAVTGRRLGREVPYDESTVE